MSKYKFVFLTLPAVILCVILSATTGAAQTTTGSILGTVQDQTQAVLPGVDVTITNTGTGAVRQVITDDAGRYVARQLTLGNYEVEATLPGFQTGVRSGIQLTVGREAIVNFSLAVGEISERVQVTGDAPLIETTSSTISGLVDQQQMQDLPLNGRSFFRSGHLADGHLAKHNWTKQQRFRIWTEDFRFGRAAFGKQLPARWQFR